MNKYLKIALWIIGLAVFAKSCLYLHYTHLSDDELAWVKCSRTYPRTSFYSADGDKATMEYLNTEIYNSFPIFSDLWGSSYYDAQANYSFNIAINSSKMNGYFSIHKIADSEPLYVYSSLDRLRYRQGLSPQAFEMNGFEFKDCIIANLSNSDYKYRESDTNHVVKFVISKRYGLIYFRLRDGREFSRRFRQKTQS